MRRTRAIAAFVAGAALLSLSTSADARKITAGHQKSWGKEGVTLEQYAADSSECAREAAEMDLSGTAPAQALVLASRLYETWWDPHYNPPLVGFSGIARIASPRVQWNRAATIMQHELEACLTARGYVKFELTDDQYAMLRHLERGSDERRVYLHSLASDPDVLATQTLSQS